jgi:serine/threonine protein kinase
MVLSPLYCDACGAANRIQATFCFSCGQSLHASNGANRHAKSTFLFANQLLKQRYRIHKQVGKGGFGAVYQASDLQFANRLVAIKEMSQQNMTQQEFLEATSAFRNEANLLASLVHPNLPRIYEQFTEAGRWYLVMDFIEGETLESYLLREPDGKISVDKALSIGIQLCTVLEYLHNRQPPIIFRDLKPANIMLTALGHIYLIDFGIARHFKPGQNKDTTALGSTGYAAPEQYGKAQTTPRADIYALGATLHELLSGINPANSPFNFTHLNLPTYQAHIELDQLISRMVAVDPTLRPISVLLVRQNLERIVVLKAGSSISQYTSINRQPPPDNYQLPRYRAEKSGMPVAQLPGSRLQKHTITVAQSPLIPRPLSNTHFIGAKHSSRVTAVAWSSRGARIASASYDKTVRVWDALDGNILLAYQGHWDRVLALAWSPDGNLLASAGNDGTIQIWDPVSGKLLLTYRDHVYPVLSLTWSSDGKRIVSSSEDKKILIWNTVSGQTLYSHQAHDTRVLALGYSPDDKYIASAGEDKLIHVWSTQNEKINFFTSWFIHSRSQFTYRGHFGRVNALAWSPSGQRIASVGSDKTLQIWDVVTGRKYFVHRNPSSTVTCVAWSYDGRYLATGANDKLVQIWDTVTRNAVSTYSGHTGYITSVSWAPDGKQVVSASVDHTIQAWYL